MKSQLEKVSTFNNLKNGLHNLMVFLDFKMCSVIEDGCEVRYHVDRLVTGDEDMIVVYFNRNQSDAKTLNDNPGTA